MEQVDRTVEMVGLDDLQLDPNNARLHTEESEALVNESLLEFGPARSIVVDADGIVRAGNGTVEQARRIRDINQVMVVDADKNTLVAVRRTDLTEEEWARYGVADNRSSDLSTWRQDVLRELNLELDQGLDPFFTWEEIEQLQLENSDESEADSQAVSGDEDGEKDEHDEGESSSGSRHKDEKARKNLYPLAIVLDFTQYQRWKEIKGLLEEQNDIKAFLKMMAEMPD